MMYRRSHLLISDSESADPSQVTVTSSRDGPRISRVIRRASWFTTMAGAFSGHLLDSFKQSSTPIVVTSGAMSFTPQAHGFPATTFGNTSVPGPSEETAVRIATIQAKLNQKLGPEFISQRPGPGGGPKLTYAEGWKIINLANEVFGFNGWSSSVVNITTDFMDYSEESRRYNVGVTAIVRVTLRDGVYHEDVGYGLLENSRSKGAALDKVILALLWLG